MAKNFKDLSEPEILALAISNEETDGRVYADFAARLKDDYPATAQVFKEMETEEDNHRRQLIDEFRRRFGEHIPLIRREDVKGFITRKPVWLIQTLGIETVRRYAESMEVETQHFYERAAARISDISTRKLLGDLAQAERQHVEIADELEEQHLTTEARADEDKAHRRLFVLQIVQPGLSGLMDGSVSTLAPVFAAAFATQSSHDALLVGLAASVGAGISMGFAEALSDDGSLPERTPSLARTAQDVRLMLQKAFKLDGPALVEALVYRQELSMPPTITIEQATGFGMFMLKAVISGRGDELVDLAKVNLFR